MSRRDPGVATGGTVYEPASNVVELFPGAGITPAPAGPSPVVADLDAIGERYVAYAEAVETDDWTLSLLARACADDVPALRDEIHRLTVALREARHG